MPRRKGGHSRGGGRSRKNRTKEEWEGMIQQNPDLAKPKAYHLPPKTNESFEKYYQGIGIVPEDEWETFLNTMRKPLPTTFRITGSRSQAQELLKIIKGKYFSELYSSVDGSSNIELKSLPWYPDELAWQLDFTRKQIKNDNALGRLHGFLISETESGNISRQEAVSMLPPLLMDIQPHHKILDMCAAPGSKTAQLIEMLHSDDNIPVPEGFVVANDMDNKRCYLMTHQVKRIQSPNCMIINHDARCLPNMVAKDEQGAEFVKYDRILCDVPCSGDGTMRKNPDIWSKWNTNGAYNLHKIQKKVLQRGLELLAVGGRLVYSTCSLNPVEDEAVILHMVKKCEGSVEVVDVSDRLTGLKYSKGTYSWKIMSKKGEWYERVDQAPGQFQNSWDDTIFPPVITEAQDAKLERCIRVLPHQQNTGAFFIAVLTKTKELPWLANKPQRRLDPVINPKGKQEKSVIQRRTDGSEHFSYSVKHKYAKCNLCEVLLQSRNDYLSHKEGKKHKKSLEALDIEKQKEETTENSGAEQVETEADKVDISETSQNLEPDKTDLTAENKADSTDLIAQNVCNSKGDNDEVNKVEKSETTLNGKGDSEIMEAGTDVRDDTKGDQATSDNASAEQVSGIPGGDTAEDLPPPAKKARVDDADGEVRVSIQGHREDPFIFCSQNDPIWPSIQKYYDISDDFNMEQMMYRNMKRVLYYVSKPIRNLVICNDDRVKFINLGVKCFSNAPSPLVPECDYRLSQEGLLAIQQHVKARRVRLTKQDVITVLSQENPFICKLSQDAQEYVYALDPGSTIFHFKPSESDPEPNVEIVFCGWRGKTSVRSFVAKDERTHYLRMCGVELSDIQAKVKEMKMLREATVSASGTDTPVGVPSGDEAELEQWNKEEEPPRGPEAIEAEEIATGSTNLDYLEEDNLELVNEDANEENDIENEEDEEVGALPSSSVQNNEDTAQNSTKENTENDNECESGS